ncbi:MAG: carboxypeptidase-like regulatory domain-containing protein, partial [Chloroflexota bacterium]
CSAPPASSDSGIEGQVFIGPNCPVVQVGQECPDQPYQATLTVNNSNGRKIVQIQTDVEGRFKIPLDPGKYILHPESPNVMPSAGEQTFTVEAGKFTQVTVNYDSGIR